ncbi:glycogen debranching protein [Paenibacillus silvae]|jgi:glycogen debranching enzyme|uniref:alpha-L-rhamnosidase-related protein n=1 Tax=Paenibacillus silvae TaxID=1325358 RepID=UPI0025A054F7|nr:glycogen debranching protein [Paenibacillus silvae]MDM5281620.1 glycogen debranching protein [Paenibacillus silvae]
MASLTSRHPFNLYYNAGEYVKICGTQDGYFPDFGHHMANEMGGVWLHPIKLLDGFWLKVTDLDRDIAVWARADGYTSESWGGSRFDYDHGLSHIPVSIERSQFAPDDEKGMVAEYEISAYGKGTTRLKLELLSRTDLRPVWYSDEIGIIAGTGETAKEISSRKVIVKDNAHDWYVMIGSDLPGTDIRMGPEIYGPEMTAGKGTGVSFVTECSLQEKEVFRFRLFVAGSELSRETCEQTYAVIERDYISLKEQKQQFYHKLDERAMLTIEGEDELNEQFAWVKRNTQWLVQQVDGIGRGLTAGGPTYPWWFGCDSTYALQGVLATGDHQLVKDTLNLLLEKSREANGNGRFVHEVTTMGAVSNPGNTQETAHYIAFVWEMFLWTGDETLLREHYDYCVRGIKWLLDEMDQDGDLFPSGYGIIEIAGLNMELIDSAVYTAKALQALEQMSLYLGETERNETYQQLAEQAVRAVNAVYWSEQNSLYTDAVAPVSDILPKVDYMVSLAEKQGITGYREYVDGLLADAGESQQDRGWLLNKNWVIVTPMEAGIADQDKAERALETMRSRDFIGNYGTYLAAIYQQGTMTISTGAHAVAEAAYGHPDHALDLLRRMGKSFSRVLPGSFSEMSPDYGCVVQAWTIYALAVPVVRYFFGIQPEAQHRRVTLAPDMPQAWKHKSCSLEHVAVGDAQFDFYFETREGKRYVSISNTSGWTVVLDWKGKRRESSEIRIEWQLEQ